MLVKGNQSIGHWLVADLTVVLLLHRTTTGKVIQVWGGWQVRANYGTSEGGVVKAQCVLLHTTLASLLIFFQPLLGVVGQKAKK